MNSLHYPVRAGPTTGRASHRHRQHAVVKPSSLPAVAVKEDEEPAAPCLSPIPEASAIKRLEPTTRMDVGDLRSTSPQAVDDDSMSESSCTSSYSVASLDSIVSAAEMVKVRVRDKKTGKQNEYLVPKGTSVKDVVDKYASDLGKKRHKFKASYRETRTSRLGARYSAIASNRIDTTIRKRQAPSNGRRHVHRPQPPGAGGFLGSRETGFLGSVLSALGSRRDRPTATRGEIGTLR